MTRSLIYSDWPKNSNFSLKDLSGGSVGKTSKPTAPKLPLTIPL